MRGCEVRPCDCGGTIPPASPVVHLANVLIHKTPHSSRWEVSGNGVRGTRGAHGRHARGSATGAGGRAGTTLPPRFRRYSPISTCSAHVTVYLRVSLRAASTPPPPVRRPPKCPAMAGGAVVALVVVAFVLVHCHSVAVHSAIGVVKRGSRFIHVKIVEGVRILVARVHSWRCRRADGG